jgi:hypothetical protein
MVGVITLEVLDAANPAPGGFSATPELYRERTVFHRGRLELLNDIRDRVFGVDP